MTSPFVRDFSGHNPIPSGRAGEARRLASSLRVPATGRRGQKVLQPPKGAFKGRVRCYCLRQMFHLVARDHRRRAAVRHLRRVLGGRRGARRGRFRVQELNALAMGLRLLATIPRGLAMLATFPCQGWFSLSRVRGTVSASLCGAAMDILVG